MSKASLTRLARNAVRSLSRLHFAFKSHVSMSQAVFVKYLTYTNSWDEKAKYALHVLLKAQIIAVTFRKALLTPMCSSEVGLLLNDANDE